MAKPHCLEFYCFEARPRRARAVFKSSGTGFPHPDLLPANNIYIVAASCLSCGKNPEIDGKRK